MADNRIHSCTAYIFHLDRTSTWISHPFSQSSNSGKLSSGCSQLLLEDMKTIGYQQPITPIWNENVFVYSLVARNSIGQYDGSLVRGFASFCITALYLAMCLSLSILTYFCMWNLPYDLRFNFIKSILTFFTSSSICILWTGAFPIILKISAFPWFARAWRTFVCPWRRIHINQ